ncbi:GntR family transcriptional regulator [Rhizobium leguminosarum]|uniref:AsnC family transcriptional regulator n=1 Tax=Rhizobium leguminosarum bv. trifolii TaxID=386 RepID=A0A1B8R3D6_RHILT|nr:GntR family transcriptional regulator [Rhizobium leguminosarum]AOO93992.1 AsnC family transcriptional regulator [Rhizobium leguminosarum bv. trifolii]MBY5915291.1 GntR family transcriptional regulator [Rhizobium leguminosarum]NKK87922.1 FCD domain-containing protein [Rhizobium leguminosarum bv. viciae]OBY03320.1 AsnC family transcriptional regulator [Rhizobium leguminosarum bv. trifolii]RWX38322.1 GntR family transcriptional regulator [Rhizobium leguminosarum]
MENGFETEDDGDDRGLLSDRIRNALTDEIAAGRLAAGAALDEQQLADRFGASRTPVREALRQLAAGGLVELRARRGGVVARMTPERIMEMFETVAEIEAVCVRLATYRMTPLERSRLIELHELSEPIVEAGNFDAYDSFNRQFHETIYRATHNGFLAEQAIAIRNRLNAFRRTQLRQGERLSRSRDEHEAIMQAIAEGDGEMASRRMRAHMLNAATSLSRFIEANKPA